MDRIMKYSFSQIKMIHECPFKYLKCYIQRIKTKGGIHALFGQAMHALLKDVIVKHYDRATAIKYWASYFEKEVTKDGIRFHKFYDWLLKKGYPLISMYFKNRVELDIVEVISVEVRDEMEFDGNIYIYVCDLIYKNSKGEVVLLDYKTGKKKDLDIYQIEFYSWQKKYKIDKMCLYYFGTIDFYTVGEYKEKVEKFVREAIDAVKKEKFFKIVTDRCKYCDLQALNICDAKPSKEDDMKIK